MRKNRVTLPVLVVLLAFVVGAAYLVYRANEGPMGDARGALDEELDADAIAEVEGEGSDGWWHHEWTGPGEGAERPPGPPPGRDERIPPGEVNDEFDPQMWAMRRSFHIEDDAGVPLPFEPMQREARIVDSEGTLGVSPNARCNVRVLPVQTQAFNCLVRVVCDGHVLYPNPTQTAGYVPCELEGTRPVSARDDGHSALDGDPLIELDLRAGTVTVEDRGDGVEPFRATLRLGDR